MLARRQLTFIFERYMANTAQRWLSDFIEERKKINRTKCRLCHKLIFCDRMEEHLKYCYEMFSQVDRNREHDAEGGDQLDQKFLEISSEITQQIHQLEMVRATPKVKHRQLGFPINTPIINSRNLNIFSQGSSEASANSEKAAARSGAPTQKQFYRASTFYRQRQSSFMTDRQPGSSEDTKKHSSKNEEGVDDADTFFYDDDEEEERADSGSTTTEQPKPNSPSKSTFARSRKGTMFTFDQKDVVESPPTRKISAKSPLKNPTNPEGNKVSVTAVLPPGLDSLSQEVCQPKVSEQETSENAGKDAPAAGALAPVRGSNSKSRAPKPLPPAGLTDI